MNGLGQGILRPGEAGVIEVGRAGKIKLVDWVVGDIYDTVPSQSGDTYGVRSWSGTIAAGRTENVFVNLQAKTELRTNLTTGGKLPSGWEMIIWNVEMLIPVDTTARQVVNDVKLIHSYGYMEFKVGGKMYKEGNTDFFPGRRGLQISAGGATGAGDFGANNGVPAAGAVPPIEIPDHISAEQGGQDFKGIIKYPEGTPVALAGSAATSDTSLLTRVTLHGWLKRQVR